MKFPHFGRKTVFGLILALAAVPAFSLAQVYTSSCGSLYTTTSCTPGVLHVFMLVNNNSTYAYTRQPADFTVNIQAQNPSLASFPASQSGTHVTLSGSYTVQVQPMQGFTPTYSVGCSGTVVNGQEATCVITESASSVYTSAPVPYQYQYPYGDMPLTCLPAYQTIPLGQSASFNAVGGSAPYSWSTPDTSYPAIGAAFNASPRISGVQTVTVMSGTHTSTCTVNVLGVTGPVSSYIAPIFPSTVPSAVVTVVPSTALTSSYVPALPNTGFEPLSATQIALALVVLFGVGIFAAPYVRKTLAAIV